jgi:hypothetical protein
VLVTERSELGPEGNEMITLVESVPSLTPEVVLEETPSEVPELTLELPPWSITELDSETGGSVIAEPEALSVVLGPSEIGPDPDSDEELGGGGESVIEMLVGIEMGMLVGIEIGMLVGIEIGMLVGIEMLIPVPLPSLLPVPEGCSVGLEAGGGSSTLLIPLPTPPMPLVKSETTEDNGLPGSVALVLLGGSVGEGEEVSPEPEPVPVGVSVPVPEPGFEVSVGVPVGGGSRTLLSPLPTPPIPLVNCETTDESGLPGSVALVLLGGSVGEGDEVSPGLVSVPVG